MGKQPPKSEHKSLAGADELHEQWIATYRTPERERFVGMLFNRVVKYIDAPPGSVVLDAGCGTCANSVRLVDRGLRCIALDFSDFALRKAGQDIAKRGMNSRIALCCGSLLELPFRDGEVDYILCWGVLMHIPKLDLAVSELARVLRPGGKILISESNMHSLQLLAAGAWRALRRRKNRPV